MPPKSNRRDEPLPTPVSLTSGPGVEALLPPRTDDPFAAVEAQLLEVRNLQRVLAETRATLARERGQREVLEQRTDAAERQVAKLKDELERVAEDAILPREAEKLLARRTGQLNFEITAEGRYRVSGFCRGSGVAIGACAADVVKKLLGG
jgi:hypothetical protein